MSDDSSAQRIARRIAADLGDARPGAQLPSSRSRVAQVGVSATTVQRALGILAAAGTVVSRPGAGTFVADRREPRVRDTTWQDVTLGASLVDTAGLDDVLRVEDANARTTVLPMAIAGLSRELRADLNLSAALARAARRPDVWDRPPLPGLPELRSWFGAQVGADAAEVIITPGGQGALSSIMRAIVPAGEPVLFATPTYPGALAIARSAGQVPVPVPGDEAGIRPDLLDRALERTHARLLYLQPAFANPTGAALALERRAAVLEVAHRHGLFVIEDDWARWLGHGASVPPPLFQDDQHGHVITVSSLSKAVAPGLRVGAISARGQVAVRLAGLRLVDDFYVSGPLQHAAVEIVTAPAWRRHLRATGRALGARCAVLLGELARALPDCPVTRPAGGVSCWFQLPPGVDDVRCAQRALEYGVAIAPGRHYQLGENATNHVRLCFGSVDEAQIPQAVERFAAAVDSLRS
jgi:DNA-binding transcriptional MocR family regulator